mmetsp:Transcript_69035/g.202084  ORF Transcript_69035/g.202084 Transcript_69035/m.202084 type:complete len:327 (-) Transcript_69035:2251-3231(-)
MPHEDRRHPQRDRHDGGRGARAGLRGGLHVAEHLHEAQAHDHPVPGADPGHAGAVPLRRRRGRLRGPHEAGYHDRPPRRRHDAQALRPVQGAHAHLLPAGGKAGREEDAGHAGARHDPGREGNLRLDPYKDEGAQGAGVRVPPAGQRPQLLARRHEPHVQHRPAHRRPRHLRQVPQQLQGQRLVPRGRVRAGPRHRGPHRAVAPRGHLRPGSRVLEMGQGLPEARLVHGRSGAVRAQVLRPLPAGGEGHGPAPAPRAGGGLRGGLDGGLQEGQDDERRGRRLPRQQLHHLRHGRGGLRSYWRRSEYQFQPLQLLLGHERSQHDRRH